ncbi:DUF1707 SHOCT-like domain-containing protein [Microlunatus elymi]|uniref:DUF1707 SHOCT-like domain-containing protein n=1 Tax=Microlunatus elymi TaxID=2596828 RepID=UPI00143D7F14|nr:DUF1707 domain-containing protein [Microlunatus elymi]
MNDLPISSKYRSTPDAAVSADEREQLTRRLNDAFAAGQLDQDDYSAKLDRLFSAHRLGELIPVVEGLPGAQSYAEPDAVRQSGQSAPGELTAARSGSRLTLAVIVAIALVVIIIAILLAIIL